MKNLPWKATATAATVACLCASMFVPRAPGQSYDELVERDRINKGLHISPVPMTYAKADQDRVGLGSYLVNAVGGCNDCHTNPSYAQGGDPFLGQPKKVNAAHFLAGGQQFGPFVSRNLTPENGLPAGHSFAEFLDILRTGRDYDNPGQTLQVMPWPTYQSLSEHDIRAIYEYLKSIPPAKPAVTTN
jgi:hypothetical protein